MDDLRPPPQPQPVYSLAVMLFPIAGLCWALSLFNPALQFHVTGWEFDLEALNFSLRSLYRAMTSRGVEELIDGSPFFLVTLANATLVATFTLGWRVHRKHAVPMLLLTGYGLASALAAPLIASLTHDQFGNIWHNFRYSSTGIGYWLWIMALVFATFGWRSVIWLQHQLRTEAKAATAG